MKAKRNQETLLMHLESLKPEQIRFIKDLSKQIAIDRHYDLFETDFHSDVYQSVQYDQDESSYKRRFSFKVLQLFVLVGVEVLDFVNEQYSEGVDEDYLFDINEMLVFLHAFVKQRLIDAVNKVSKK